MPSTPPLELERRGDTVVRLIDVRGLGLAVGVQIDETRRDDQVGRVDQLSAGGEAVVERRLRDRFDHTVR